VNIYTDLHDHGFEFPDCPLSCLVDCHIQKLKDHGISARSPNDQDTLLSSEASGYLTFFSEETERTRFAAHTKYAKGVKNHRAIFRSNNVVSWKEKHRTIHRSGCG